MGCVEEKKRKKGRLMLSHYSIGREKKKKSSLAWVLLVLRNKIEMQSDAVPVASRQARGQLGQLRVFVKKNCSWLGLDVDVDLSPPMPYSTPALTHHK